MLTIYFCVSKIWLLLLCYISFNYIFCKYIKYLYVNWSCCRLPLLMFVFGERKYVLWSTTPPPPLHKFTTFFGTSNQPLHFLKKKTTVHVPGINIWNFSPPISTHNKLFFVLCFGFFLFLFSTKNEINQPTITTHHHQQQHHHHQPINHLYWNYNSSTKTKKIFNSFKKIHQIKSPKGTTSGFNYCKYFPGFNFFIYSLIYFFFLFS